MIKTLLKPLASLRLTVVLLALSMFLVYAGTWAQVAWSIWDVQGQYFHSLLVWIPIKSLVTRLSTSDPHSVGLHFPFPGGYTLGLLLLINLLAAHWLRFKFAWKRTGIILIHLGLIMLLVGEGISSRLKVEDKLQVSEGETVHHIFDDKVGELAIIDRSPADHDNVIAIAAERLRQGGVINVPGLPFALRVDAYYENSTPVSADDDRATLRSTTGPSHEMGLEVRGLRKAAGTGDAANANDYPATYVTPLMDGKPFAGTFCLASEPLPPSPDMIKRFPHEINEPQPITVNGKTYLLQCRWKQTVVPYSVSLKKFSFDRYPGTSEARNYSSDIHFVDGSRHEDRMVHIWMNHPLRYNGQTIYQASFVGEHTTILQVVRNPAWTLPYIACAVGGLGLVIHFGLALLTFIGRQRRGAGATLAGLAPVAHVAAPPPPPGYVRAGDGKKQQRAEQGRGRRSTATPPPPPDDDSRLPSWATIGVPALVGLIAVACVISHAFPHHAATAYDVQTFAQLPVMDGGRIQPLDQVARVTLRGLRGRDHIAAAELGRDQDMSAGEWLMNVMCRPEKASALKVFRVDYPELADRLSGGGGNAGAKYFSLNDVLAHWDEFSLQLFRMQDVPEKQRTDYQRKLGQLASKVRLYLRLGQPQDHFAYAAHRVTDPELKSALGLSGSDGLYTTQAILDGGHVDTLYALADVAPGQPIAPEASASPLQSHARQLLLSMSLLNNLPGEPMLLVPAAEAGADWQTLEDAVKAAQKAGVRPAPAVLTYAYLRQTAEQDNPSAFNELAGAYLGRLQRDIGGPLAKARFETQFNSFDPFYLCIVLYVTAFVLVCCSWLGWSRPLYRSAVVLVVVALAVHAAGLVARIYISGRPPVTNLTSASIFIAFGAILMALGTEYFFRNSIGLLAASAAGFCSLLLADRLSLQEGDTLKVLQAVLDTNFWLATHVVCVTLGYAATFLAGLLGVIYIVRGLFTDTLTRDDSRELMRMTYGVVCFGMLFSFVGTVLGGIWADQSWGRFWGWDSKENGAVLVVLTNAILLHARWGGLIRERGIATMAVFGIMITQWSFLGTNQLGVGLHSYGFTDGLWSWLLIFWGIELVFICMGLVPLRYWASFASIGGASPSAAGGPASSGQRRPAQRSGKAEVATA